MYNYSFYALFVKEALTSANTFRVLWGDEISLALEAADFSHPWVDVNEVSWDAVLLDDEGSMDIGYGLHLDREVFSAQVTAAYENMAAEYEYAMSPIKENELRGEAAKFVGQLMREELSGLVATVENLVAYTVADYAKLEFDYQVSDEELVVIRDIVDDFCETKISVSNETEFDLESDATLDVMALLF